MKITLLLEQQALPAIDLDLCFGRRGFQGAIDRHLTIKHLQHGLFAVITYSKVRASHTQHPDRGDDLEPVVITGSCHIRFNLALLEIMTCGIDRFSTKCKRTWELEGRFQPRAIPNDRLTNADADVFTLLLIDGHAFLQRHCLASRVSFQASPVTCWTTAGKGCARQRKSSSR